MIITSDCSLLMLWNFPSILRSASLSRKYPKKKLKYFEQTDIYSIKKRADSSSAVIYDWIIVDLCRISASIHSSFFVCADWANPSQHRSLHCFWYVSQSVAAACHDSHSPILHVSRIYNLYRNDNKIESKIHRNEHQMHAFALPNLSSYVRNIVTFAVSKLMFTNKSNIICFDVWRKLIDFAWSAM